MHYIKKVLSIDCKRGKLLCLKGSVPLTPGEKSEKNQKIKILFIVWSQCVLLCFNSYMKEYQYSKLNTYLVTLFISEWGYCVYIEIPLRLSPVNIQSP